MTSGSAAPVTRGPGRGRHRIRAEQPGQFGKAAAATLPESTTDAALVHQHPVVAQFTGEIGQFPGIFAGRWPHSMCGGRSATVGSVNLITHVDQAVGTDWPGGAG
jgi:hypothetical protein